MAIVRVQAPALVVNAASATTVASTFGSNVAAGNLLVALVCVGNGSGSTTSVSSTGSPTWVKTSEFADTGSTGLRISIWYCANCPGGATTVTVTFSVSSDFRGLQIAEYSGAAISGVLDVNTAGKSAAASTTPTDDSMTTTADGDLIVSSEVYRNADRPASAGSGFTAIGIDNSVINFATEDQVQATAGAIASTFTLTAGTLTSAIMSAAFKAAVAPALARQAQPGRTWRRRYRHRQMPPTVSAVAPAVPEHAPIFPSQYGGYY